MESADAKGVLSRKNLRETNGTYLNANDVVAEIRMYRTQIF